MLLPRTNLNKDQMTYAGTLIVRNGEQCYTAGLGLAFFTEPINYLETVDFLHPDERMTYQSIVFERRKKSFLLGRYSAKLAAACIGGGQPNEVLVRNGIFNQPIVYCSKLQNYQVTISHCENFGGAIVFPEAYPLGIDIEVVDPSKEKILAQEMTQDELNLLKGVSGSYESLLNQFWTLKEALSKVLKTGLMIPLHILEIGSIEISNDCLISHFRNFGQYKGFSFYLGSFGLSIIHPKQVEIILNISYLKDIFNLPQLQK